MERVQALPPQRSAQTLAFDFKGHPLVAQTTAQADWSILFGGDTIDEMATAAASLLDAETVSASSERDALDRVLTAVSPDGSDVHYHYDEGGALQRVTLHHRGSSDRADARQGPPRVDHARPARVPDEHHELMSCNADSCVRRSAQKLAGSLNVEVLAPNSQGQCNERSEMCKAAS